MRFTQAIRIRIVRSIMADVPQVDYDARAHELVRRFFHKKLPASIRKIKDDKGAVHHLRIVQIDLPDPLHSVRIVGAPTADGAEFKTLNGICMSATALDYRALLKKINEIAAQKEEQSRKLYAAKSQLQAAFDVINTSKRAIEIYPQFEKYIPAEPVVTKNLPMVTTVVSDLEALGWPPKPKQAKKVK